MSGNPSITIPTSSKETCRFDMLTPDSEKVWLLILGPKGGWQGATEVFLSDLERAAKYLRDAFEKRKRETWK